MKLKKIKLSGFKSFVDPTTVHLQSNLTGVVGPNGCGKSNLIDAIRWVMGEISAKQLRGESMSDVIFNGSSARKAVGQAVAELAFDNSDATLGGEYAKYNEIAIRREVNRDGFSDYFLNNTNCRRKDITNIFLGVRFNLTIIEGNQTLYFVTTRRLLVGKPGDLVSLIPLLGDCWGVTTIGLKWRLQGETLKFGFGRGISNVMTGKTCRVRLKKGRLLVVYNRL